MCDRLRVHNLSQKCSQCLTTLMLRLPLWQVRLEDPGGLSSFLSPGTPRSVQDRTAGSTGSRFEVSASAEEARRVVPPGETVGSERESEGGGMPIGDLSETR